MEYAFWKNEIKHYDKSLKFYVKFDYSYDGILRSYEDSIQRIGFSKIDMLVIHDLDFFYHGTEENSNPFKGYYYQSKYYSLTKETSAP